MKKILVVLTGGTIGSTVNGNIVEITEKSHFKLIEAYEEQYGKTVEFDVISPINTLSENINPNMWNILFNEILKMDLNIYSGIIIAHGSDTLSYTSAAAGFLLGHLSIPTVLVASCKPIGEEGSNGLANFRNAVCLIKQKIIGVFCIYSDMYGNNNVYLATRILEADRYNDNFQPFGNVPYGIMKEEKFIKCEEKINDFELKPIEKISEEICLKRKVMTIHAYPGLDYESLLIENGYCAVLHTLYHSSTADENGLKAFAKRCAEAGVDLYLCCFKKDGNVYSSMTDILDSSAVPLINISVEAAYVKLLIAYNTDKEPKKFMSRNIYYEII